MLKIISWNIARRKEAWQALVNDPSIDFALLQEANQPPDHLKESLNLNPGPYQCVGGRMWRSAIANLSGRYHAEWIETIPLSDITKDSKEFPVSVPGTIALAKIHLANDETVILASVYGLWHGSLKSEAMCHRIISDLSFLINSRNKLIIAGDFNLLYGCAEQGDSYWKKRYDTVFTRMESLGLRFVGPQFPNGQQADPWPEELPKESLNVPTFYFSKDSPDKAFRQLDYVFASESIADRVIVAALNHPDQWGPSDHCQIQIGVK